MSEWHRGQPPHVGWWNASVINMRNSWRWWDGKAWSDAAFHCFSEAEANHLAKIKVHKAVQAKIMWTYDWPEGARVPRINPETGEVTGGKV